MKIFMTGASGFIGAHTARTLLAAGHELRLLVRKPAPVRAYFEQHGHELDDFVVADMRDADAIARGLDGCDAVFHAAALVSLDRRRAREIYRNNVDGIDAVLGTAARAGIERLVYVSSLSVLFQDGITRIDEDTPLGNPAEPYALSKRDCDAHVRTMQESGLPIQMSYPSAVIGPDDPKLSEGNGGIRTMASSPVPLTSTGFQAVDVRDLALAHRHMLESPDAGHGRFIVAGHYLPWAELRACLEQVTGRRIPAFPIPGAILRALGHIVDGIRRVIPFESQLTAEGMNYATRWVVADSARILQQSGIEFRDVAETYGDTIAWLHRAGHLAPRYAGELARG